jgi:hypothetical protein
MLGMRVRLMAVAWSIALATLAALPLAPVAEAQVGKPEIEYWAGSWRTVSTPQFPHQAYESGHVDLTLYDDWTFDGGITNTTYTLIGVWSGFIRDDGIYFATYRYGNFSGQIVGQIRVRNDTGGIVGSMVFHQGDEVSGGGMFTTDRRIANPTPQQAANDGRGRGADAHCSAPSVCGFRGGNALPGNWEGSLWDDIRRNYPGVMPGDDRPFTGLPSR